MLLTFTKENVILLFVNNIFDISLILTEKNLNNVQINKSLPTQLAGISFRWKC